MSTYAMSDIHGCYDELNSMLSKIGFSSQDRLVIAGDYMDRGPQSYEMLEWVCSPPENVVLLKGNHDIEFAEYIDFLDSMKKQIISGVDDDNPDHLEKMIELADYVAEEYGAYFDYYGTIHSLSSERRITLNQLKKWRDALIQLPFLFEDDINGKHFIVVHAGYVEKKNLRVRSSVEDFYIYAREEAYEFGGKRDSVIIAGHTPTISPSRVTYTGGRIFKKYNKKLNCTYYDIDCGAVFSKLGYEDGRMACLRLDDEKEFYL
ncbi:serine/threonine protein phosphatase 1 [Lachnospiraceae bacterium NE2001]|nr:serine/threonine protein phosphatase 1 [Lachnospiraceae bacterium NE2001]